MKLGTPFFILLLIAFAFTSVSLIVNEFRIGYPDAGNVSTSYESKYNYMNKVNGSFLDISAKLENIGTETSGWKIFLGAIYVIPLAVLAVVVQMILTIPYLGAILTGTASELGVPSSIIAIGLVAIVGAVIIMLVKFVKPGGV